MRLNKFLIIILLVTTLASVYVHQQVRIIQLAYEAQGKLACLRNLIDENKNLRYNINRSTSLISLAKLWQNGDFEWPHHQQLVDLSQENEITEDNIELKEAEGLLARWLRLRSQAEATPIKSPSK